MTLHVEIINPYPATTVKDLLETKLLILVRFVFPTYEKARPHQWKDY